MDKKVIIANWKSNKSEKDAETFLKSLRDNITQIEHSNKELIIAPSYLLFRRCCDLINELNLPVKLCAQNVSSFPKGSYTGEVNASQIKEFCEYVIIGHSERKKYLHENESDIENKAREANEAGLKIIQCVQDENSRIFEKVTLVAYEPPTAIGSGNPDDPEHIEYVFKSIHEKNPTTPLLYGGSIDPNNIGKYLSIDGLSGFLVGGASLDIQSFINLLKW